MHDLLHFLQESVNPFQVAGVFEHWRELIFTSGFTWIVILGLLRFDVPAFAVWIAWLIRPSAFQPPSGDEPYLPMVSAIVAGRNPGEAIRRTIRSLLDSGYPRLEIIYVDDFSTDDSVAYARAFERTGRVRVFAATQHNGKPSNLNVALSMARGELAFVLDADAEVDHQTIAHMVRYFRDPEVGGVSSDIRLRNASHNLLTRIQELEYALNGTIARSWRAQVGILPILPGASSMFRMSALRALGGYDTGLGDDTDMTVRLRKRRWKLKYALDARMWTDQPETIPTLFRQRMRWARNMVKVRFHKHLDLATPKYGLLNVLSFCDLALFRVLLPLFACFSIVKGSITGFGQHAVIFTAVYLFAAFFVTCKALIANDMAGSPPFGDLLLVPLYLPYRLVLRTGDAIAIVRETLRIRLYHSYVPKHIWSEIPHW